jgi:hypothetical protein
MPIGLLEGATIAAAVGVVGGILNNHRNNLEGRVLADLLNSALGDFIQDLDADDLSANILSGEVDLTDLELKASAFDGLGCAACLHELRLRRACFSTAVACVLVCVAVFRRTVAGCL